MPGAPEASLSRDELAARAGVDRALVDDYVARGILAPDATDHFTPGDARRITMVLGVLEAGLPLDGVAHAVQTGLLSLGFADSPVYARFASLTDETFDDVAARTGLPMSLLAVIHEAVGTGAFTPQDRLREDELAVVPFVEVQVKLGFRSAAIERLLRATTDSLRRIAEAEAEWFRSEVADRRLEEGRQNEIAELDPQEGLSAASEQALLAILHSQQAQTWMVNIVSGFEYVLAKAGLHRAVERHPAICFLDITGYTRLTQERGDQAAASLAEGLATLVKRASSEHGGRPVKWLGDGVMCYFRDPGPAVLAALDMVEGTRAAGFPPAHVGVHSGPVVIQQGDYYGQTVNLAARIADYARPGEVLVSREVVEASAESGLAFDAIGDVELKGVSGAVALHSARRVAATVS